METLPPRPATGDNTVLPDPGSTTDPAAAESDESQGNALPAQPYAYPPGYPPGYPSGGPPPTPYWWTPPARRPRPAPEAVYRPGVWFYWLAIVVVMIGLVNASLPSQGTDGYVWLAGAVLAFVWFVAFVIAANDSRLGISSRAWARWAGIPALGILFVALTSSGLPVTARFELSRPSLDAAADSARSGHPQAPGWIGLMPVDRIDVHSDGVVTFVLSGTGNCGLANFSGEWPATSFTDSDGFPITRLSSTWWTWCEDPTSD